MIKAPTTTCGLDPIPSGFVKQHIDYLLPFLTNLVNKSLKTGVFPCVWKDTIITPPLKKADLSAENLQPVSNLAFISKLTEQVVAMQKNKRTSYNRHNLSDKNQSAYTVNFTLLKLHY